jgi:hypothetical protein
MHFKSLEAWRDYDREVLRLGEFMRLDLFAPSTDADLLARDLFDSGGRLVVIKEVLDLDVTEAADTVRFFELLRELTSYGIAVEWRLRTSHNGAGWPDLWHLFPPSEVVKPAGVAGQIWEFWQREFYYGLCVMRRGPGMIEVRDRRSGKIRRLYFTSARQLQAIEGLEKGALASSFEPEVLAEFEAARLVMAVGDMRLWLPCRFRRSPIAPVGSW